MKRPMARVPQIMITGEPTAYHTAKKGYPSKHTLKPCLIHKNGCGPQLKPAVDLGFTLYGGTAIAPRLGYKTSVDFDIFSEKPLNRDAIQTAFKFAGHPTVLQDER